MKLLLDTHTLLWSLISPKLLSRKAIKAIESPDNSVYVSTISLWEISLKFSLDKLLLENISPADLPEIIEQTGFELIEPSVEEYAGFYQLPRVKHKDPFDRMLIWQSIQRSCTLVTKDGNLKDYKPLGLITLW